MNDVYAVVPDGIDDPKAPSGGNAYDRRISLGLAALGWTVHERPVPGAWPAPDGAARAALTEALAGVPDGAAVLVDGLIGSATPDVLVPESGRLRLVVVVHMPLGLEPADVDVRSREGSVLTAASAVVSTSAWTRRWLIETYALPPAQVHVAPPGVDVADLAPGTPSGGELLCVAAVTPGKGHDVLLEALATIKDLPWRCVCVGSRDVDPIFAERVVRQAARDGITERVRFTGPLVGADLDGAYAAADVLVLASHAETYGMVVTEALARGVPVIATEVGGVPDTLGADAERAPAGLLVAPGDAPALAGALRRWLADADLRQGLRLAARRRRETLTDWSVTAELVSWVLKEAG